MSHDLMLAERRDGGKQACSGTPSVESCIDPGIDKSGQAGALIKYPGQEDHMSTTSSSSPVQADSRLKLGSAIMALGGVGFIGYGVIFFVRNFSS
jgi:hypothetical protein